MRKIPMQNQVIGTQTTQMTGKVNRGITYISRLDNDSTTIGGVTTVNRKADSQSVIVVQVVYR